MVVWLDCFAVAVVYGVIADSCCVHDIVVLLEVAGACICLF